jgi:methanogenic corrinoid protein MtbC1
MRRLGCEIAMSYDEDFGTLTARLMQDAPDLVLITCARRETLETAAKTVQTIRKAALREPVIALGGAVQADEDEIKEQTGVDIVTNVAVEAVAFCTRQIRSQKPS